MSEAYYAIANIGRDILDTVRGNISSQRQQLAYYSGLLPALALNVIERHRQRTGPQASQMIATAATNILQHSRQRLNALGDLLDALSPEATLRRGYSITRINGHAITDSSTIKPGDTIETILARGEALISQVK